MREVITEILLGGLVLVIAIWLIPYEIRIRRLITELKRVDADIGELALVVALGLVPHEIGIKRLAAGLEKVEADVAKLKQERPLPEVEDD